MLDVCRVVGERELVRRGMPAIAMFELMKELELVSEGPWNRA